ncbi:MAG: histidine phosphatase family protein [Deltaproteobacteria bacterium]|nr:histidine phosphatase family protein [Deltaproteobacteria bacterium]
MRETRFTLVRHAESEWNAAGRWQGHGDPPLSERGVEQAHQCAERFAAASVRVDRLVCSDLVRTRQTAAAIAARLGLTSEPTDLLRELAIGRWTGMTREEIARTEPQLLEEFDSGDPNIRPGQLLEEFDSGDPNIRPGGGETRNEIRLRVRGVVETLAQGQPGQHLVLVVHAGVIKALVPEANPANTEWVEISLEDIRKARPSVRFDPAATSAVLGESAY